MARSKQASHFDFRYVEVNYSANYILGLDDYPRGEVPNPYELHVDLISWIAFASSTMHKMYDILGMPTDRDKTRFSDLYKGCLLAIDSTDAL